MILHGDCLDILPTLPDESIDMVLCDLPYGKTELPWDVVIPMEPLWGEYRRLIKTNGAIVLFATNPFASDLISAARDIFKYDWVWTKNRASMVFHCKNRPMRKHESILVFSKGVVAHIGRSKNRMTYNPQGLTHIEKEYIIRRTTGEVGGKRPNQYGKKHTQVATNYPDTILDYSVVNPPDRYNKTQKPLDLCEYLIRTYTDEGSTVLDNAAGSGTTGIAAIHANRNYILIEKEEKFFHIIEKRVEAHSYQQELDI